METIIGLLIALVIFVFRVIGKKLEQAAQNGSVKPASRPLEGGIVDVEAWIKEAVEEAADEETEYVKPVYEPLSKPVEAPVKMPEKVSVEENVTRQTPVTNPVRKIRNESVKSKEKIDPKKLIVYSEIMKPKYTE